MTPFACPHCQATVFFENVSCGRCATALGFDPAQRLMVASEARGGPGPAPVPCHNRLAHDNCNWMVDDASQGATLCRSCRLTRTIPDLSVAGNAARWARIEQAKRRLLHGLDALGLMPEPRRALAADGTSGACGTSQACDAAAAAPDLGLCFDLLADTAAADAGMAVRTGHADGVITLNIAEADDAHREAERVRLGEPQRTLLGHLRHEVSHYLQYRWIAPDALRTARWREVFGDEGADYGQALDTHYRQGPAPDWATRCISAYASAHPWEDWAETCAHWLLIVDATQTAAAWGLRLDGPADADARQAAPDATAAGVRALVLQRWLPVAQFLNAMNRSIGAPDSYPFLMPQPVLDKLAAVADLLHAAHHRGDEPPHSKGRP